MIDIGVNLANAAFDRDRDAVVRRAREQGVAAMLVTGTSVAASAAALALADGRRLFATAGVHPHDADGAAPGWDAEIARLAARPEVVAIGETGLDYYRDYADRSAQRRVFQRQVELAVQTQLPLFVHDRDTGGDTRRILADCKDALAGCVIHCFTGSAEELDGYLEDGYCIGITGWICDERRGGELARLAHRIPLQRLLIETDAPYLLPRTIAPKPRSRRNEPAFLPWVARRIAECREESAELIGWQSHANAARLFRLPQSAHPAPPRPER